ncbi:MAG: iron chelate uptake ABC transporter family permease subunit, partial [Flavobacteriales bacterium]
MVEKNKYRTLFILLLLMTCSLFILDLSLGSVYIPFSDIIKIFIGSESSHENWENIIFKFRIPKTFTALLVGVGLAISGLQMQILFRNPLAGPFILGISSGASLGVALLVLGGSGLTWLLDSINLSESNIGNAIAASFGSFGVLFIILALSRKLMDNVTLLIVGLMIGYLTSAFVSILMFFSRSEEIHSFMIWTFGSFSKVTQDQLWILSVLIMIGVIISIILSKWLNALLLGESYAKSMGTPIQKARLWSIISTGLLAGSITAFCGPIAFLGIAVPHLARSLFNTSNHHVLLPAVILVGSIIALCCDIISQVPGSQTTLPLNAITSLVGAPVVLWVVIRLKNLKA